MVAPALDYCMERSISSPWGSSWFTALVMAAAAQVVVEWLSLGVLSGCLEVQAGGSDSRISSRDSCWCRHGPHLRVLQEEGMNRRGRSFDVETDEQVNNN